MQAGGSGAGRQAVPVGQAMRRCIRGSNRCAAARLRPVKGHAGLGNGWGPAPEAFQGKKHATHRIINRGLAVLKDPKRKRLIYLVTQQQEDALSKLRHLLSASLVSRVLILMNQAEKQSTNADDDALLNMCINELAVWTMVVGVPEPGLQPLLHLQDREEPDMLFSRMKNLTGVSHNKWRQKEKRRRALQKPWILDFMDRQDAMLLNELSNAPVEVHLSDSLSIIQNVNLWGSSSDVSNGSNYGFPASEGGGSSSSSNSNNNSSNNPPSSSSASGSRSNANIMEVGLGSGPYDWTLRVRLGAGSANSSGSSGKGGVNSDGTPDWTAAALQLEGLWSSSQPMRSGEDRPRSGGENESREEDEEVRDVMGSQHPKRVSGITGPGGLFAQWRVIDGISSSDADGSCKGEETEGKVPQAPGLQSPGISGPSNCQPGIATDLDAQPAGSLLDELTALDSWSEEADAWNALDDSVWDIVEAHEDEEEGEEVVEASSDPNSVVVEASNTAPAACSTAHASGSTVESSSDAAGCAGTSISGIMDEGRKGAARVSDAAPDSPSGRPTLAGPDNAAGSAPDSPSGRPALGGEDDEAGSSPEGEASAQQSDLTEASSSEKGSDQPQKEVPFGAFQTFSPKLRSKRKSSPRSSKGSKGSSSSSSSSSQATNSASGCIRIHSSPESDEDFEAGWEQLGSELFPSQDVVQSGRVQSDNLPASDKNAKPPAGSPEEVRQAGNVPPDQDAELDPEDELASILFGRSASRAEIAELRSALHLALERNISNGGFVPGLGGSNEQLIASTARSLRDSILPLLADSSGWGSELSEGGAGDKARKRGARRRLLDIPAPVLAMSDEEDTSTGSGAPLGAELLPDSSALSRDEQDTVSFCLAQLRIPPAQSTDVGKDLVVVLRTEVALQSVVHQWHTLESRLMMASSNS